jgi:hypothetical protein
MSCIIRQLHKSVRQQFPLLSPEQQEYDQVGFPICWKTMQGERTVSSAAPVADFRSSCEEVRP